MTQRELINDLKQHTSDLLQKAKTHRALTQLQLIKRPAPGKWNVLECYEHMNRYGTLYIGYFEEALLKAKIIEGDRPHTPGLIGGYSARSMEPQEVGVRKPMKTFKKMDPTGEVLELTVIDQFIKQHEVMLQILERVSKVDIDRMKCRTTIKFLRFKLSDALTFFTNHNRRHVLQAERTLEQVV